MQKSLLTKLFFAILLGVLVIAVSACKEAPSVEPLVIDSAYPGDSKIWDNILDIEGEFDFSSAPLGMVIPHHLVPTDEMVKMYKGLAKVSTPKTIVIIGPNHFKEGGDDIQTCIDCVYKTTRGDVEIDSDLSKKISEGGVASAVDQTFAKEHAIYSHTPFIESFFPDSKILPILIMQGTKKEKINELVEWLDKNLKSDEVVVASVDFSHFLPVEMATFHDQSSYTTIQNFDLDNIFDLEIDSPESIFALMSLSEKRGYKKVDKYAHTNIFYYRNQYVDETTSHQFFTFSKGEIEPRKGFGIFSFGLFPGASEFGVKTNWKWDQEYDLQSDNSVFRYLDQFKRGEDRMISGADAVVFDIPENECIKQTQNGIAISFCKPTLADERGLDLVASQDSDIVYVLFDFANNFNKSIGRKFADAGADIFVGRSKKIENPELYNGSLIFHSLGSFAGEGVSDFGMALGVFVGESSYFVYPVPVKIENGHPKTLGEKERLEFFENFYSSFGAEASLIEDETPIFRISHKKFN